MRSPRMLTAARTAKPNQTRKSGEFMVMFWKRTWSLMHRLGAIRFFKLIQETALGRRQNLALETGPRLPYQLSRSGVVCEAVAGHREMQTIARVRRGFGTKSFENLAALFD